MCINVLIYVSSSDERFQINEKFRFITQKPNDHINFRKFSKNFISFIASFFLSASLTSSVQTSLFAFSFFLSSKSSAVLITFLSLNISDFANFELYVRFSHLNFINLTILIRVKQLFVAFLNSFFKLTNFLLKDLHAYLIKRQISFSLNQHALYHSTVIRFINIFDDEDLQNVVQHRFN